MAETPTASARRVMSQATLNPRSVGSGRCQVALHPVRAEGEQPGLAGDFGAAGGETVADLRRIVHGRRPGTVRGEVGVPAGTRNVRDSRCAVNSTAMVTMNTAMTASQPSAAAQLLGDLAPGRVQFNTDLLTRLEEIWPGPGGEAPESYAW